MVVVVVVDGELVETVVVSIRSSSPYSGKYVNMVMRTISMKNLIENFCA